MQITHRTAAEIAADNLAYEKVKSDFQLFGKWQIKIGVGEESYPYEIFQNGEEYIGIVFQNGFKKELLEKRGNEFHVKGVDSGEFYRVDGNLEMTLFDKDGNLGDIGYEAIKV